MSGRFDVQRRTVDAGERTLPGARARSAYDAGHELRRHRRETALMSRPAAAKSAGHGAGSPALPAASSARGGTASNVNEPARVVEHQLRHADDLSSAGR